MKYIELVKLYDALSSTSSKLKKVEILANFLEKLSEDIIEKVVYLCIGTVFPSWSEEEIGIASKLTIKAISRAYGVSENEIMKKWKEKGDLGLIVEEIAQKRKQLALFTMELTIEKVFNNLKKASLLEGHKSQDRKITLVSELLMHARPDEAKYIVRTVLGDLRIGVAEGIIRDAIAKAFFADIVWSALFDQAYVEKKKRINHILEDIEGKKIMMDKIIHSYLKRKYPIYIEKFEKKNKVIVKEEDEIKKIDELWKKSLGVDIILITDSEWGSKKKKELTDLIERAYSLKNDLGLVAKIAMKEGEKGLKNVNIEIFKPIRVMLAQRAYSIKEAFNIVKRPAAIEYKYDGFRMQIHKKGDKIELYTRRLERVTKQFPDVVERVKKHIKAEECVIEGETVGIDPKTGRWLPFQKISRRIRRKYDINKMMEEIPVLTNVFDVVYLNGSLLIDKPFKERRKILERIVEEKENEIILAKQIITDDDEEAGKFYQESLDRGNEGVMFKNLNAEYKPGCRVGHMVKLKPTLETLDLVIVGAEWGEGKRSGWLTSYVLACRDEDTGELLTVGKISTGLKEKSDEGTSYEDMTNLLKPLIIKEKGKEVEVLPKLVVEVSYEEIQKSPNYTSGYALRFPRFVRLRDDKSVEEIDTLQRIEQIYHMQRHREE